MWVFCWRLILWGEPHASAMMATFPFQTPRYALPITSKPPSSSERHGFVLQTPRCYEFWHLDSLRVSGRDLWLSNC